MYSEVDQSDMSETASDDTRERCVDTSPRTQCHRRRSTHGMNKVTLNVGGERFTTYSSTLRRRPGTLLSTLSRNQPSYDSQSGEHYFDRNPRLFPYILDFYRNGEVHFPHCTCGPVVSRELEFWGISDQKIATCCWKTYKEFEEEKQTLDELDEAFSGHTRVFQSNNVHELRNSWTTWKLEVLRFLDCPSSSKPAKVWASIFISLMLISIALVVAESHPWFRVPSQKHLDLETHNITNPKLLLYLTTDPHPVLSFTDYTCTFIFSLELLLKFLVWPRKLTFFCSFFNLIDTLSVSPMLSMAVIRLTRPRFWIENNEIFFAYCIMSASSVFRSVRILRLVKHNRGLQVMYLAMKHSAREILLLLLLIFIGTLVFSTMIFFAEFKEADSFLTIPIGFWWSIVTMTTVGYGDVHPTSGMGYLVGSACAIAGMLATGLPIPVIANSFHLYYTYARIKDQIDQRRTCESNKNLTEGSFMGDSLGNNELERADFLRNNDLEQ